MKTKSPPQVTEQSMLTHVQAVTDDVRSILKGGLSFLDGQLPFQVVTVNITSGQPSNISINAPFSIVGCIPINTSGAQILNFITRPINNVFTVTLTLNVTSASIKFLVVGINT